MAYNDSVYFQQEKIQQVVSRLTETKDSMIKIKNDSNLDCAKILPAVDQYDFNC